MAKINSPEQEKWLGNQAFKEGDFEVAIEHYSLAIKDFAKTNKELPPCYSNRAMCHLKMGNYNLALSDAIDCIKYKPEWFKGYHRKAEAHFGLEEYEQAELAYADALANKPGQFESLLLTKLEEASYAKEGLIFRQLLTGRDMAVTPISMTDNFTFPIGQKVKAFSYIIGDTKSKECVLVDPSFDLKTINNVVSELQLTITGVIITSYHPDHCGGVPKGEEGTGTFVQGVTELVDDNDLLPVYIHPADAPLLKEKNFILDENIIKTEDGYEMQVGEIDIKFMHTPGPTKGSQVVVIKDSYALVGDLVFPGKLGTCAEDTEDELSTMYESIYKKLFTLSFDVNCYPGHDRGGNNFNLGEERRLGCLIQRTKEEFIATMQK